jgi:hypothetical protein
MEEIYKIPMNPDKNYEEIIAKDHLLDELIMQCRMCFVKTIEKDMYNDDNCSDANCSDAKCSDANCNKVKNDANCSEVKNDANCSKRC